MLLLIETARTAVISRYKDGHEIEPNVLHFKKIHKPNDTEDADTSDEFENFNQKTSQVELPQQPSNTIPKICQSS